MSAWKWMIQLPCFLLQLECVRLTDVCPDSDSFCPNWRCLMVAGTVTLHAELPPGSPNLLLLRALVGSPILQAPAQQVLDVSRDKPPLLPKLVVCPHWCACKFGILGDKKLESLLVAVSCCCLLGAGSSSPGVTGASPALKWVLGVYRLPGWKQLLGLSCTFTRVNAGGSALEIWEKLKAEERLNSLCTNIYDLTQLRLCPFMRCEGGLFCLSCRNCGHSHSEVTVTDTAAEPHWQRLGFNFWHWVSAPKSCCFVSVHSSAMGKPLRKEASLPYCCNS